MRDAQTDGRVKMIEIPLIIAGLSSICQWRMRRLPESGARGINPEHFVRFVGRFGAYAMRQMLIRELWSIKVFTCRATAKSVFRSERTSKG